MFKTLLWRWQRAHQTKIYNRRANHALNGLNDRMLKDIGLCRCDLLAIKYGSRHPEDH